MEHTGMYRLPIAKVLKEAEFFVSVVNAKLIHDFGDNRLRKPKTDKADSLKISSYALAYWETLRELSDTDNTIDFMRNQSVCTFCHFTKSTKKEIQGELAAIPLENPPLYFSWTMCFCDFARSLMPSVQHLC